MSLLQLNNVRFSYLSSGANNFLLKDVNLSIKPGEFISVLGANGSGKSTLINLMCGLLTPTAGSIELDSIRLENYSAREISRKIALVPQSFRSVFPYSIYEIVMMGRTPYLKLLGYESKEDIAIVEEALKTVEIYNLRMKGINEVSGGEAQRAFIARALVQQPDILLLDEPNAHLDIKHQLATFSLLKNLNEKEKISIVSVSHDLNLAAYYSGRIIMMKFGEILLDDRTETIINEKNIEDIFETRSRVDYDEELNSFNIRIIPE